MWRRCFLGVVIACWGFSAVRGDAAEAPATGAAAAKDAVKPLSLQATDGTQLSSWCYAPGSGSPQAIVILLHDLGGSHRSVEAVSSSLQAAGCLVIAPDLRGHGESMIEGVPKGDTDQSKVLKRQDFEMMAATRGGTVRTQASVRGDIETVRNWIKSEEASGHLDEVPLFVVGSGMGATLAAAWAVADAAWPDIASGPQGREVAGLVLISPTYALRGFSMAPALSNATLKQTMPIMVIGGKNDRDATKVFDLLKRARPKEWHESGDKKSPVDLGEASVIMLSLPTAVTADALASQPKVAGSPIPWFISTVVERSR